MDKTAYRIYRPGDKHFKNVSAAEEYEIVKRQTAVMPGICLIEYGHVCSVSCDGSEVIIFKIYPAETKEAEEIMRRASLILRTVSERECIVQAEDTSRKNQALCTHCGELFFKDSAAPTASGMRCPACKIAFHDCNYLELSRRSKFLTLDDVAPYFTSVDEAREHLGSTEFLKATA